MKNPNDTRYVLTTSTTFSEIVEHMTKEELCDLISVANVRLGHLHKVLIGDDGPWKNIAENDKRGAIELLYKSGRCSATEAVEMVYNFLETRKNGDKK